MQKETAIENLRTPNEVKDILRCSRTSLWKITKNGDLPSLKIGRLLRYRIEDINTYIASRVQS